MTAGQCNIRPTVTFPAVEHYCLVTEVNYLPKVVVT